MNEYIVTCRSYEDLENLYDDMETPGGSLYIPDRAVDLVHRRAISRNTHYMLTEEEAAEIRNDERVIACERQQRTEVLFLIICGHKQVTLKKQLELYSLMIRIGDCIE